MKELASERYVCHSEHAEWGLGVMQGGIFAPPGQSAGANLMFHQILREKEVSLTHFYLPVKGILYSCMTQPSLSLYFSSSSFLITWKIIGPPPPLHGWPSWASTSIRRFLTSEWFPTSEYSLHSGFRGLSYRIPVDILSLVYMRLPTWDIST